MPIVHVRQESCHHVYIVSVCAGGAKRWSRHRHYSTRDVSHVQVEPMTFVSPAILRNKEAKTPLHFPAEFPGISDADYDAQQP